MYSVIVVPPTCGSVDDRMRIATGERLAFGGAASDGGLTIAHEGAPGTAEPSRRVNGKKESLVSLALRFDLVREDDLAVPAAPAREVVR